MWPALAAGRTVLCRPLRRFDRGLSGLRAAASRASGSSSCIGSFAGDFMPDLTLILDLPVADGLARAPPGAPATRPGSSACDPSFHERLRAGFPRHRRREPERCVVIDAAGAPPESGRIAAVTSSGSAAGWASALGPRRMKRESPSSRQSRDECEAVDGSRGEPEPEADGAVPPPRENPELVGHEAAEAALERLSRRPAAACLADHRPARHRQGDAGVPLRALSAGARRRAGAAGLICSALQAASGLAVAPNSRSFAASPRAAIADLLVVERGYDPRRRRLRSEIVVDDTRAIAAFPAPDRRGGGAGGSSLSTAPTR